ncbi:MAG: HEAT repeat domain-containing protein [Verrucomicrobiota bacterium]
MVLLGAMAAVGRWAWPGSDVPNAEHWVRRAFLAPDQVLVEAGQRLGTNVLPGLRRVMIRDDTRWERLVHSDWVWDLPSFLQRLVPLRLTAAGRFAGASWLWQQVPGHRAWYPELLPDAFDPSTRNRATLVEWIGRDPGTRSARLEDFLRLAGDPDPEVRRAAATVMGEAVVQGDAGARTPEFRRTLEKLSSDQVAVVREVAVLALGGRTRATEFE